MASSRWIAGAADASPRSLIGSLSGRRLGQLAVTLRSERIGGMSVHVIKAALSLRCCLTVEGQVLGAGCAITVAYQARSRDGDGHGERLGPSEGVGIVA
ncbi:hypothetical protein GCM10009827_063710 [Dactylosporangium maewongense]|uniref:Uncharacterized protein n=1 Tax=Dactylosporangium maewongense TaxID=634393 RepID=A0ABN2BB69_9ACTN